MGKITRETMLIFASSAGASQLEEFGSLANGTPVYVSPNAAGIAAIQSLSNYLEGWFGGVVGANLPAMQDLNALCFLYAYQLAYIMQAGIAEWDAGTTYYTGSLAQVSGVVYMSRVDTNLNHSPAGDNTNWKIVGGSIMTASGDIIYGSTNGNATRLPKGTDSQVLTLSGGLPVWSAPVPVGAILPYGASVQPSGFLFCWGRSQLVSSYQALWSIIGNNYGTADGATTTGDTTIGSSTVVVASATGLNIGDYFRAEFGNANLFAAGTTILNIVGTAITVSSNALATHTGAIVHTALHFNEPYGNGQFLRGIDNGAGVDPDASSRTALQAGGSTGDVVGSAQAEDFLSHGHSIPGATVADGGGGAATTNSVSTVGPYAIVQATGGNETRPVNMSVNYIIKT